MRVCKCDTTSVKCVNCQKTGHSCLSHECEVWIREKDICRIKVEQELSYAQARKQYEASHEPPKLKAYATVTRSPSAASKREEELKSEVGTLKTQVGTLEKKLCEVLTLLEKVVKQTEVHKTCDNNAERYDHNQTQNDAGKTSGDLDMNDVENTDDDGEMFEPTPGGTSNRQPNEGAQTRSSDRVNAGCEVTSVVDAPSKPNKETNQVDTQLTRNDKKTWERSRSSVRRHDQGEVITPSPVIQRANKKAEKKTSVPTGTRISWIPGS